MKRNDTTGDFIYALRHSLLNDYRGRIFARNISLIGPGKVEISHLKKCVKKHRYDLALSPIEPPQLFQGALWLGFEVHNKEARTSIETMSGHGLCEGGSGSGKSTLIKWFTLQLASHIEGSWLFQFEKSDFSALVPLLQWLGVSAISIGPQQLIFNPIQVPTHCDPRVFSARATDNMIRSLQLPPRAAKAVHLTLLLLYEDFGVLQGGSHYPTLFDFRIKIAKSTINPQAREAILDSLDPILMSIGNCLRYRVGWTTEELAKLYIIFEFQNTGIPEKNLLLSSMLVAESSSRLARGLNNRKLDLWIACDDAARLVSAANPSDSFSDLIGLVRSQGISILLATQTGDIAPSILSNTANRFLGRTTSVTDMNAMCGAMGCTAEQRQYLSQHLSPGMFLCQLGQGWRVPFLLRIPRPSTWIKLLGINVQQMQKIRPVLSSTHSDPLTELNALPVVEATEFRNWRPDPAISSQTPTSKGTTPTTLCDAELRFLTVVVAQPCKPSSTYPKLAKISPKRAKAIRKHLIDLGFLREQTLQTNLRGRSAIILEPLQPAKQLIHQLSQRGTSV